PHARDHPLAGADDGDGPVRGEGGRLVERLHRRELVAGAEQAVDVGLRQVAMPRGDGGDQVRAVAVRLSVASAAALLPEDGADNVFDLGAGSHGGCAHASFLTLSALPLFKAGAT